MRIKALVLASVATIAVTAPAHADTVRIGIAAEPYPPFAVPDAAGNYTGWEIDIIHAVCEEAALDCEIVATAWDGIIPSLLSERIDVIAASLSHYRGTLGGD